MEKEGRETISHRKKEEVVPFQRQLPVLCSLHGRLTNKKKAGLIFQHSELRSKTNVWENNPLNDCWDTEFSQSKIPHSLFFNPFGKKKRGERTISKSCHFDVGM